MLLLIFLILLVSSIVMLRKRKIKTDACVKITVFIILSILSWTLFQSVWISLALIISAVMGLIVLVKVKNRELNI